MKKLAILLIAILGITGCQASDTSSEGLVISQAQNARMEARAMRIEEAEETTVTTYDIRAEQTNEIGWYIYDLEDVEISVSDPNFLIVNTLAINPEYKSMSISYNIRYVPIKMTFVDTFGNVGKFGGLGDGNVSAYDLDLSSKKYTVTLEFAERDDVTIEITLP